MSVLQFDVFLSHNSKDKPIVQALDERLRAAGLRPFLDSRDTLAGRKWVDELEAALQNSRSLAVVIGPNGLGPWQKEEVELFLIRQVGGQGLSIIPVMLPGASSDSVPAFLRGRGRVDLTGGLDDALNFSRLVDGITGNPLPLPAKTRGATPSNEPEPSILVVEDSHIEIGLYVGSLRKRWPRGTLLSARSAREALECLDRGCPDLLIADLRLPYDIAEGAGVICRARDLRPNVLVLVVTAFDKDEALLLAHNYGVQGFLPKNRVLDGNDLVRVAEDIWAGRTSFPTGILRRINELLLLGDRPQLSQASDWSKMNSALTKRQGEVFFLIGHDNLSNGAIAQRLYIEVGAVEKHVGALLKAFHVANRNQLRAVYKSLNNGVAPER